MTANAQSRIYGDANPVLTYAITEGMLVNNDTLTGALTTAATLTDKVGDYAIEQGSLAASDNYDFHYVGAKLTVTPADLIMTYRATPATSIYGNTPLLTGTVSALGLKNGDALDSVTKGAAVWSSTGDATSDIGTYAVTGSGLSGNSGNYDVTFVQDAANMAALTITSRALTVTADALRRLFGDANPALTYSIGGRGLVNGDTLTGALATDADRSSIPGPYAIKQGTLTVSTNYSFQFVPGVLTVLDVGPVSSMTIASTQARDAFAAIVNRLTGIDSISSVAGLLPLPDDGLSEQAGSAAGSQVPVAIDCLRKRPCPAEIIAPR